MSSDDKKQEAKSKAREHFDLLQRGVKEPSPIGSTVFVGLRSLDPFLQYGILKHGYGQQLLHKIGLETLPPGLPTNTGATLIDKLGLSPYRLILVGMSAGTALKHIYWLLVTSQEALAPSAAVSVAAYNITVNSISDLLFTTSLASASLSGSGMFPQPPLIVGATLYVAGMLTEIIAETQRAAFKRKPENKGKPYTEGLWKFARHINYAGYTLWRAGYATAAGGWIWGAVVFAFQFYDFSQRAVPVLNDYCEKRYGADWEAFKKQTPYKVFPYVW